MSATLYDLCHQLNVADDQFLANPPRLLDFSFDPATNREVMGDTPQNNSVTLYCSVLKGLRGLAMQPGPGETVYGALRRAHLLQGIENRLREMENFIEFCHSRQKKYGEL